MSKSLTKKVEQEAFAKRAIEADIAEALTELSQHRGYGYLQSEAARITDVYKCEPTDKERWEVYTHIQFAFNQLFGKVRQRIQTEQLKAKQPGQRSILAEIQKRSLNNGRGRHSDWGRDDDTSIDSDED